MKRLISIFTCLFLLSGINCIAQSRVALAEKPAGTYPLIWDVALAPGIVVKRSYNSDFVLGVETRIEKKFSSNVAWTASVGYTNFSSSYGFITGKAGLKTFFAPKVYVAGEIGLGEYTQGGEAFIYAVSFGIKAGNKWDLSLKYEDFSSTTSYPSQVALRIGYKLSK
ncbi:MAG: hypothetical protein V4557_05465 [Bacteroidota bacterium]